MPKKRKGKSSAAAVLTAQMKPAKRRRSKDEIRRSRAAKKGWETRRKKALRKERRKLVTIEKVFGKPVKTKAPIPALAKPKKPNYKKLLEDERATRKRLETELAQERMFRGFVPSSELEWLRQDGTVALEPCALRHLGDATTIMIRELNRANMRGATALRAQCIEYAGLYNVSLREVYTLFFSA